MGLTLSPSTTSSTITKSTAGFASANDWVEAASSYPTVSTNPQPVPTACSTFGSRSVSDVETSTSTSMPNSSSATCSPSQLAWLNERSSRPPELVTIRAQKSVAGALSPPPLLSGAGAQPVAPSATAATARATKERERIIWPPLSRTSCRRCRSRRGHGSAAALHFDELSTSGRLRDRLQHVRAAGELQGVDD